MRRLDLVEEVIDVKREGNIGNIKVAIRPNPERYEWLEGKDGVLFLHDKLDDSIMQGDEVFARIKAAVKERNKKGIPSYNPLISNANDYVEKRRPLIESRLENNEQSSVGTRVDDNYLERLGEEKWGFVVLSLDIVGSTEIASERDEDFSTKLIPAALHELGEVIPKYHGHILRYTGDGLIAYFAAPAFISMNDLALDCAITLLKLVYRGLNQVFNEHSLPTLDIRIGINSGDAYVGDIGSPSTKQSKEVIGSVVALAEKIQGVAQPGEIYIGEITLRNLHTNWRRICHPVELDEKWVHEDKEGKPYKVFKAVPLIDIKGGP